MDRKINLIEILKDRASILRAAVRINRHVSSIHMAILRATSHDPSSPPSEARLSAVLELGQSSRFAACTCIEILMDRLHDTTSAFVALKCLFTIHNVVSNGNMVMKDQISYHPCFGGRNFLNMSMFCDKSDLTAWGYSLWVRWYAAVVEQNLIVSKQIGYYILNTANKNDFCGRYEFSHVVSSKKALVHDHKAVSLVNNDLVSDVEVLVEFVASVCDAPEDLSLQKNNLVYEIVRAVGEDYRAVQLEISFRVRAIEGRIEDLDSDELTRLIEALGKLEDCKESLVLLFVNRKRNDGLWELVRRTKRKLEETKDFREERRLVVREMSDLSESKSTQCWNPFLEPGQLLLLPSGKGWLDVGPTLIAV